MSKTKQLNGSCLCGKITLQMNAAPTSVGACHCNRCRKWGGGPFITVDCGVDNLTIANESDIAVFDSTQWADRGFCKHCGTHLFYRLKAKQQYIVPAGVFDEDADFLFDHQVFVDMKPHYYDFSNQTKKETEAEVFGKYS